MRVLSSILLSAVLASCTQSNPIHGLVEPSKTIRVSTDNPVYKAANYLGYGERTHRTELKALLEIDPVRTEWCAAFVNSVLEESGIPSNKDHAYPLTARAFLDWGKRVKKEDVIPGDVVIFPRGTESWQGHVGFYLRTQVINNIEYWWILGGNQRNKVSVELYRPTRALGVRRQSSI